MAIKKIPCGGWLYDDETITFEDGVMKVIGGGGISEAPIDGKQYARKDAEWSEVQSSGGGAMIITFTDNPDDEYHPIADKTPQEAMAALISMSVLGVMDIEGDKMPLGNAYFSGTAIGFLVAGVDVDTGRILYYINGDVSDNVWTVTGA